MPIAKGDIAAPGPHIEFRDVSFSYAKKKDNLTSISFALEKGESLGIIGPTGSGKSTVLKLLMRLYDADSGAILINGRDVRTIEPETLYHLFGVVFQNDFLYADSFRENIDFGRGLQEDDLRRAVDIAQASYIFDSEEGMDRALAIKGQNLSGGQRQRLLLARALAGNPDILLLDDSSSALDFRTEAAFRRALAREFADTTRIIVAQRVSSIKNCDQILVLSDGKAVGLGTHENLLRDCPYYQEIAEIQMGEVS